MKTPYEEELASIQIKILAKSMLDYFTACDRLLTELETRAHFNSSQPRVPAGNPTGGQWTDTNGGSGGGTTAPAPAGNPARNVFGEPLGARPARAEKVPKTPQQGNRGKIDGTVKEIEGRSNPSPTGWCAQYVRESFEKNGIKIGRPPVRPGKTASQARDYGPNLVKAGFKPVASGKQPAISPDPKSLKKGDVVVIQRTSRNEAGHMAVYSGSQWISDYKQPGFWPGDAYRAERPDYAIYRMDAD